MRTLVVNAYSSEKGTKRFQEFVAILRPILMHYDKSAKMVSEFVYAPDLNPKPGDEKNDEDQGERKLALKYFDSIDVIFIDGDEGMLPWSKELSDLFGLVRLAYQMGKGVFTTACGAQILSYVNALGGERLQVVNGPMGQRMDEIRATDTADPLLKELFAEADIDGGGTLDKDELTILMKKLYSKRGLARSLKDIREELEEAMEAYDDGDGEIEFAEFQEMVTEMRSFKEAGIKNSLEEAHFLESTSGDIYMFRVVAMVEKYVPYKNIGMRRKQMKQAKGTPKGAAPFSRFIGDAQVKLEMKYRSHYLFGNLSKNTFPAPVELSWDIHLDTKPQDNGLMVLAKAEQGNMILECGNIVAVRFGITKRNPETIQLLDAFVGEMHANMVTDEHLDICSQLAYQDEAKLLT